MLDALNESGSEGRPQVAVGHVTLPVNDVLRSAEYWVRLGLRPIVQTETFAVLELRGGTHLVLTDAIDPIVAGTHVPFDLMSDDFIAIRRQYADAGLRPSEVESGPVHESFTLEVPSGYRLSVVSSHTSGRPV